MPGFHEVSRRSGARSLLAAILAATAILCTTASRHLAAHELELTEVRVTFAGDGTYRIEVMNDPDWLLMRVEPFSGLELSGRLEPAQRDRRLVEMETTFAEWVHLSFDGERTDVTATYVRPTDAGPLAQDETRLGTMRLEGRVPEGAGTFSFAYGLIQDPYPLLIREANNDVIIKRPQFSWTLIRGESNVQGGGGNGSIEERAGEGVGGDGGSPEGDRSARRWRGR